MTLTERANKILQRFGLVEKPKPKPAPVANDREYPDSVFQFDECPKCGCTDIKPVEFKKPITYGRKGQKMRVRKQIIECQNCQVRFMETIREPVGG